MSDATNTPAAADDRPLHAYAIADLDALRAMAGALRESLPLAQGHHVGEPCALVRVAAPDESVLGLDRDGMAIVMDEDLAAYIVAACNAVPALVDEVHALRARVAEFEPYRDAIHSAHNGYNADMNAALVASGQPPIPTPESPSAAIASLLEESEKIGEYTERVTADIAAAALRDAEAQRDALLARYREVVVRHDDGQWCVLLHDRYSAFAVEAHPTREAAERAAAAWQQLIDAARAGAAKGSE